MKGRISKFILDIDIFGKDISLRLNNETTAKTSIGGILTIVLIIAIISFTWFQLDAVVKHINPKLFIESQILNPRANITLDTNSMPLAFGITDSGTRTYNLSQYLTFKVSFMQNINTYNSSLIEIPLEYEVCSLENFPALSKDQFINGSFNLMYCIKNQNVTIGGSWTEETIQYLSIKAYYCQNDQNCDTLDNIKAFMNKKLYYFNVYFLDNNMNPQNYLRPQSINIVNSYTGIKNDAYKVVEMFIRDTMLISDESMFFTLSPVHNYSTISYDYKNTDVNSINTDNCLLEYQLISSENKVIYHRVYIKVTDMLASIGGLANVLLILFYLLCLYFSSIKRNVEILNTIFHFDIPSCEEGFENEKRNSISEDVRRRFTETNSKANFSNLNVNANGNGHAVRRNSIEGKDNLVSPKSPPLNDIENENGFSDSILAKYRFNSFKRKSIDMLSLISLPLNKKKSQFNFNTAIVATEAIELNISLNVNAIEKDHPIKQEIKDEIKMNPSPLKKKATQFIKQQKSETEYKDLIKNIVSTKTHKHHLEFTYSEMFKYLCCRCFINKKLRNKFILYDNSEKTLGETLDVCNIIQKIDEFDKLKMILLSKQQIALFNFISKDWCSLNNNKLKNSKINEMKEFNKNQDYLAKIFINFLQELGNKSYETANIDEVNEKLLDLLHEDFKNNFLQN